MTTPGSGAHFRPVAQQGRAHPTRATGPLLVAPGSVTNHEFGLFEIEVAPGQSTPSLHYHSTFTESFYILDGTIQIRLGDRTEIASSGDFAFVPRAEIHGFANNTDAPARMLILFAPGIAREAYFAEMADLYEAGIPPTTEQIDAVARRHDQVNIRPDPHAVESTLKDQPNS